jgi:acetoin utilization protein AcuB
MRVFEVMSEAVQTVSPAQAAAEAGELMRRARIHHLVVMDKSRVVGILSDRDLKGRGAGARAKQTVADVMTRNVVTVRSRDTIRSVANVMRGRTIGCVPVVEGRRLAGIVTVTDLLDLLGGGADRPARPSRRTLSYKVPHRKKHRAGGAW